MNIQKIRSFIALFDILGFKNLINHDNLEDIYKVFLKVSSMINDYRDTQKHLGALMEPKIVSMINYSDTFLIYTKNIDGLEQSSIDEVFHVLLAACDFLFIAANESELPIRGAISVGDIILSDDVVIGKPIVEAYEMEQQQEWIGCMVSSNALGAISSGAKDNHIKDLAIVEYEIPCKKGKVERLFAYNWTLSETFKESGFRILNKKQSIDWSSERKHRNTWEFINSLMKK